MKPISPQSIDIIASEVSWDNEDAGYALPQGSLRFLIACASALKLNTVFEFGSGASTLRFLEAGLHVTTLEDNAYWHAQTLERVPAHLRARLHSEHVPLEKVWCGKFPCMGWRLPQSMESRLAAADLVLIDSPAFPPFREAALMQALQVSSARIIVLDDVGIPTLRRFCERIVAQSNGIELKFIERDHTLGVFLRREHGSEVRNHPEIVEQLKGWRRYFLGRS
jgi:hypothetical protein